MTAITQTSAPAGPAGLLTAETAESLTSSALSWEEVAFRQGPAERPAAEEGVRLAYRIGGLPEPEKIIWVDSPVAGARAIVTLGAGRTVRDAVRTRPWEQTRAEVHSALGTTAWPLAWSLTGDRLWRPVNRLVTQIRRAVAASEESEAAGAALRASTLDAVLGQHDAPWLSLFDALGRPEVAGLVQVAEAAGWWWPFERVALICERPVELHRDDSDRLHRGEGPALVYPDGFALHAWHGMPVPADFGASIANLTPARIRAEQNAELRRVMLEHFGYDRYLAESGATPVHRDETGVLWRIELGEDEPVVMVEVVNSTAEPDGTFNRYWLRVPPATRTAREGVAWTFQLSESDYHPERET
ncbi:DUF6745 domain-containing protein [Streptosporangium sp. NPDC050855]|uniref:DUF6745 domain-containing protein n=1 Tax=Streptosporangium sp. NPDC050855 TaxID=3366194 RepID=UPI00379D1AF8